MINVLKRYNTQLILLSVVLAILFGIATPHLFESIHFIGELFINLLKLFALPLICSAVIAALGDMGHDLAKLKSLARNAVGYMVVSEVVAVTIALTLFNIFHPGVGLNPDLILHGKEYAVA